VNVAIALDNQLRERTAKALDRLAARSLGYDATEDIGRRRATRSDTRAEDAVLPSAKRKQMVGTARDVVRNYVTASWMIRSHLNYVARFAFQARTKNDALDERLAELVRWASKPRNFEVTGRFSLNAGLRIKEARKIIDGDVFTIKLSSGMVQIVEGDRVRNPVGGVPEDLGVAASDCIQGVVVSPGGRMRAVIVCKRNDAGGYVFERLVQARNVWHEAYHETTFRVDCVRGITPLAPTLNTQQDIYEGLDLAMAKAKVAQMFGLTIFREKLEQHEGWAPAPADETAETEGESPSDDSDAGTVDATDDDRYDVDPGAGPFKLELEPGDRAEFLSTRTPENELLEAMRFATDMSLKALDIPYSFYDAAKANYYNRKADIQQYQDSADAKRESNRTWLDEWLLWKLRLWVLNGTLVLPDGWTVEKVADRCEWLPTGMPWVDKLRDMKADAMAIGLNLDSELRAARRNGDDCYQLAGERMDLEEWILAERKRRGLPALVAPGGGPVDEPVGGGSDAGGDGSADGKKKKVNITDTEDEGDDDA